MISQSPATPGWEKAEQIAGHFPGSADAVVLTCTHRQRLVSTLQPVSVALSLVSQRTLSDWEVSSELLTPRLSQGCSPRQRGIWSAA